MCGAGPLPKRLLLLMLLGKVAEGMGLKSDLLCASCHLRISMLIKSAVSNPLDGPFEQVTYLCCNSLQVRVIYGGH